MTICVEMGIWMEALFGPLTIERCTRALYGRMLNLAYQLVWNSFQRQGAMCSLWLPSFHQGNLHHSLQAVLCVLSSLVQEPLSVLGVVLLPGWLSAGLVTGIRLSLHLGSFLSRPLGLADSCRMVLAPVIPEPLFLKPVEALSQRTPSPENLQGPLLSGRLVWGAS